MTKNFRLNGLDCANCAAKMERGIRKIDGVQEAGVNFLTLKLSLTYDETKEAQIMPAVEAAIHKVDPAVVMKKGAPHAR